MTEKQKAIVAKFEEWGITDHSTQFCLEATATDMGCSVDAVVTALFAERMKCKPKKK